MRSAPHCWASLGPSQASAPRFGQQPNLVQRPLHVTASVPAGTSSAQALAQAVSTQPITNHGFVRPALHQRASAAQASIPAAWHDVGTFRLLPTSAASGSRPPPVARTATSSRSVAMSASSSAGQVYSGQGSHSASANFCQHNGAPLAKSKPSNEASEYRGKHDSGGAESALHQHQGEAVPFTRGARVEALYEGQWYSARVVELPANDPRGLGCWTVQCDVDEVGTCTYVEEVRKKSTQDAADVVVSKVFSVADGCEYFVVKDADGRELGSFCRAHVEFQLHSDAGMLLAWLDQLATQLLPGLLALLVDEMEACGAKLKQAEERLRKLHAPDDYHFFGLSEQCSDQELVKAYRRMCARLHPDKGGDEASFAAMRQRYDRLRRLRGIAQVQPPRETSMCASVNESAPFEADIDDGSVPTVGGNDGGIAWDPSDRKSMLHAHHELLSQVTHGRAKIERLERDIEDALRRQNTTYCLSDASGLDGQSRIEPSSAAAATATFEAPLEATSCSPYPVAQDTRFDMGNCMLCLERLPADPREVVNLCCAEPRCLCLLHLRCYLDPGREMNDHLRRCMICKGPADPELVRRAVQCRE
eukprot:TRINITY_DN109834_c0_g1_i1.p1 TRINITY_DN109834_c0_g1~~TRINITY_DN109834_c0_g1_i1.p1  ORF type:complete len:590 (+),score=80.93 TRINITY_DN109834_c0_g1_i1:38-1807(+)